MNRKELIERLMKCKLSHTLGINVTKGDLNKLTDTKLARLLTLYDEARNAGYEAQRIVQ